MKECYDLLKKYHNILTRQQIQTFKGQIRSGDYIGFKKGLNKIIKRGIKWNLVKD